MCILGGLRRWLLLLYSCYAPINVKPHYYRYRLRWGFASLKITIPTYWGSTGDTTLPPHTPTNLPVAKPGRLGLVGLCAITHRVCHSVAIPVASYFKQVLVMTDSRSASMKCCIGVFLGQWQFPTTSGNLTVHSPTTLTFSPYLW